MKCRSVKRGLAGMWIALASVALAGCGGQAGVPAAEETRQGDAVPGADAASSHSPLALGLLLLDGTGGSGSACYSPLSIRSALRLAAAGAAGETKRQLELVAGAGGTQTPADGQVELVEANAAWVDEGLQLAQAYADTLRSRHGATVSALPMRQDAAGAAERINAWVKEATRGMIGHLLSAGDLPPTTELVLTNAVYFKGRWAEPFDPALVEERPFHGTSGTRNVAMMHARRSLRYWEDSLRQMVQLPYAGDRYQLAVILPKEGQPLEVLRGLSADTLARWVSESQQEEVGLALPRFTVRSASDLSSALAGLGMPLPFGGEADFRPMTGGENGLRIGSVLHHAVVEVSEEGTEAAAATGVVMLRASLSQVVFHADRPFTFVLYDGDPRNALFVGHFDPQ